MQIDPNIVKSQFNTSVQERILMHSKPIVTSQYFSIINKHLDYIKSILPQNKHKTFFDSIRLPLFTTGIVKKVIKKNRKVFEGKNPNLTIEGSSEFVEKLTELIDDNVKKDREVFYNWLYHNSQDVFIVNIVDGKKVYEIIPISAIKNVRSKLDKIISIEYGIVLENKDKAIAVIDDQSYKIIKDDTVIHEEDHKLGYCPAFWVEAEKIDDTTRNGLLVSSLSDLDYLLLYSLSKKLGDMSGSWAVTSVYTEECDYKNTDGDYCKSGVLLTKDGNVIYHGEDPAQCPVCSNKKFIGWGSVLEMPIPDKDDHPMMPPIHITPGDVPSMEFVAKEQARLSNAIVTDLTGTDIELTQAVNEPQVLSTLENRKTVVNNVARKTERLINLYFQTVADLSFGVGRIQEVNYSLGTEFYLYNENDILDLYIKMRKEKLQVEILDIIYTEFIKTKFKNNQQELTKQLLLFKLDDYRHMTIDELKILVDAELVEKKYLIFKIQKTTLINEIEDLTIENLKETLFNKIKDNGTD